MSKASDSNEIAEDNMDTEGRIEEQGPPADDDGNRSLAVMSLYRLETDIQKLHSKWAEVESNLQDRDAVIARLNAELELRHANLQSLHDELDNAEDEREKMDQKVAELKTEIETLQGRLRDKDDQMKETSGEHKELIRQIDATVAEREAALEQIRSVERSLDAQRKVVAETSLQVTTREKEAAGLRTKIQELEAYIDRRKVEWGKLNQDLDDYRDSLVGMQKVADSHGREIKKHEKEKSLLAKRIVELEQQVAELEGRCTERKAMNDELQALCDQRAQEVEEINREMTQERAHSAQLKEKISTQEAHVDSLLSDISKKHEKVSELELKVLEANNALSEKEAELAVIGKERDQQLEESLDKERRVTEEILQERDQLQAQVTKLETELDTEREQGAELHAAFRESQESLVEVRGRLETLEREHSTQQQEFEALQSRYEENQAESVEVWDELKQARESLDDAKARLAESEEKITELEEDNKVFGNEIGTMRDELIVKNQQIAKLETELSVRKETISLLDQNVQRINDIESLAQSLDNEISRTSGAEGEETPQASGDVVRMIIARNGGQTIRFPLTKESMTIGRSMDNDIQFRQKFVSRNHARIVCGESGTLIEDLGSKNGIFVNNQPVESFELHNGDRVDIGEVQFEFVDLSEQPAAS